MINAGGGVVCQFIHFLYVYIKVGKTTLMASFFMRLFHIFNDLTVLDDLEISLWQSECAKCAHACCPFPYLRKSVLVRA